MTGWENNPKWDWGSEFTRAYGCCLRHGLPCPKVDARPSFTSLGCVKNVCEVPGYFEKAKPGFWRENKAIHSKGCVIKAELRKCCYFARNCKCSPTHWLPHRKLHLWPFFESLGCVNSVCQVSRYFQIVKMDHSCAENRAIENVLSLKPSWQRRFVLCETLIFVWDTDSPKGFEEIVWTLVASRGWCPEGGGCSKSFKKLPSVFTQKPQAKTCHKAVYNVLTRSARVVLTVHHS